MILTSSGEQIHLCACVGHLSWSLQRGNRQTLLCKCCPGRCLQWFGGTEETWLRDESREFLRAARLELNGEGTGSGGWVVMKGE